MSRTRWTGWIWLFCCGGLAILWGFSIGLKRESRTLDFQAVYYGTRCAIEHHNPYKVSEFESVYRSEGGERPNETLKYHQTVTLFVNLPTVFVLVAPLAILPFAFADALWLAILTGVFIIGSILMWRLGESYSHGVSLTLTCLLLLESVLTFETGNTAGIVIGLCLISVWCILQNRFAGIAVVSIALSLAIKPHDAGLVWLYLFLAGGTYRRRALQSLCITAVLAVAALIWMNQIDPNWMRDWSANLNTISSPGGLNNPGPESLTSNTAGMVISLQAFLAVFRNDPRFYNSITYLICGVLLSVWIAATVRSRRSHHNAPLALAAIVPLTMLVTYHRAYDAKLLLLSIPACAMIWAEDAAIRIPALLITAASVIMTGDISLAILVNLTSKLQRTPVGIFPQILRAIAIRPASIALLAMSVFYILVYWRNAGDRNVNSFPKIESEIGVEPTNTVSR